MVEVGAELAARLDREIERRSRNAITPDGRVGASRGALAIR
jgi:hypothetical protein